MPWPTPCTSRRTQGLPRAWNCKATHGEAFQAQMEVSAGEKVGRKGERVMMVVLFRFNWLPDPAHWMRGDYSIIFSITPSSTFVLASSNSGSAGEVTRLSPLSRYGVTA